MVHALSLIQHLKSKFYVPRIGAEEMPELFWAKAVRAMTAVVAEAVMEAISVDE